MSPEEAAGKADVPDRLRVGEWDVDRAGNALRRGAEIIRVEPKVMEVLLILAQRPGQVVRREELLSQVWPGVIVGDDALTQTVIKLRRALGDEARAPSYIETVSKRGYRLAAPVAKTGSQPCADQEPRPAAAAVRRARRAALLLAAAVAATALGYALQRGAGAPADSADDAAAGMMARTDELPTVMVLPFETLADEEREDILARGITADLATDLSRLAGLRVISAPSAGYPEIGPDGQPARYLVSGSVQRVAERLKVNVRLIDSDTARQLWAERFDAPFRELFSIQDQLVERLVDALAVKVSEAERTRLARRYTRSLEAYDYFLRGQAALLARQPDENERARAMYRSALALDPSFARAYAGLALTYAEDYRAQWTGNGPQTLAKAFEMARTAEQIDPDIPQVHWVLAYVHQQRRNHQQSIANARRAIALDASYADAYALLAANYTQIGQPAAAVPAIRTAMRLRPQAGHLYFQVLGIAYLFLGDLEQAAINLREALHRNPANLEARIFLTATLVAAGDRDATWEAEEIRAEQPGFSVHQWLKTYPMSDAAQRRRMVDLLGAVGL